MIKIINIDNAEKSEILTRDIKLESGVEAIVADIIKNVRENGDAALKEYSLKFDKAEIANLRVTAEEIESLGVNTASGKLKETIGDRGTGIVSPDGTPEAICKEILRYFSDKEIAARCIENIRLEKERLSWKTFAHRLIEFIEGL